MDKIPNLTFRIEPGYTFEQELVAPEFTSQNLLIGGLPTGSELNAIFLGKIAEYGRNKNIWLDCEGAHAIYVMGKRRSGKTYTLGVIVEGLASNNWIKQGSKNQAIVMIDTMNVFITMPYNVEEVYGESKELEELKRWGLEKENFNIILFYPRGTPLPPEGNSREIAIKPSDLSAQDWAALFGFDTYSDPIGQLISDLYEKVVLEGYDDIRGNRINPKEDYSIDDLLNCIDNCQVIASGYHPDTIRAVKARFNAIKRLQIFSETGINLKEIFFPGQISILLLRDLEQNLRSLLVGILVKKIMEFRSISDKYERIAAVHEKRFKTLKEQSVEEKAKEEYQKYEEFLKEAEKGLPRGWLVIDEAHNYIPAKGITPSGEPLKKYVNEGRNLGLSIVVATQNPSALDPSIRRNADILIIHSISMRDDISTAEGMINTFLPDSFEFGRERIASRVFEQLVRSLPLGYAVISNDRVNRLFVAKIRPRITVHGGLEY
jgi:DNA helicase HerA-like ATPase